MARVRQTAIHARLDSRCSKLGILRVRLYIDGQLAAKDTSPSNLPAPVSNMPRFLGADNMYDNKYKMTLDEFRVWDMIMSDKDVLALYSVDAGLNWNISHWTYNSSMEAVQNRQLL